jgi:hypothetical protein
VEAEAAFAPSRLPNEKLRPLTCRGLIMRTVSRSAYVRAGASSRGGRR